VRPKEHPAADLGVGEIVLVEPATNQWTDEEPDRQQEVEDDRCEDDGQEPFLGWHGRWLLG